jgi:2-polyprenyl-3-methyl-5-hydroxy-6-metoxy-1,4-benzoquinol methylase
MSWLPNLTRRNVQPEVMDQRDLDARRHRQALAGLARINWWSRSARIVWPQIAQLARERGASRLRVLDVASGGGDVPIAVWRLARRAGLDLDIVGCDISPLAVETAASRAEASAAKLRFEMHDAVHGPIPAGFDVVMSSLFLHHLPTPDALPWLERMAEAAGLLLLINDLRRSMRGYLLAQAACLTLTRSGIVHVDGPRSVEGAFTLAEARALCEQAKLKNVLLQKRWPFRFLICWHAQR